LGVELLAMRKLKDAKAAAVGIIYNGRLQAPYT